MAIKDQIARPAYQLANHLSRASIPRTVNQPRKSSVRDIPARQPSQLGGIPKRQNLTPVLPLNKVLTVHTKLRTVGSPYLEAETSGRTIKFHCTKKPATSRSSPRSFDSLNWVTIGRATHKEPSATKIIENNGWNRQNSREETFG
ncbi:hypothetical protein F511_15610 [Dorcoceras hygrometricum]|uniref:Uncharacterized protein n=1 Tax=Dorcoceras hygrometricum TaxID=472368 RepID=A0A2Z7AQ37_9LAMI|nr:hypothetical protein F511_15610 [Dorcoceras hygrometricum]